MAVIRNMFLKCERYDTHHKTIHRVDDIYLTFVKRNVVAFVGSCTYILFQEEKKFQPFPMKKLHGIPPNVYADVKFQMCEQKFMCCVYTTYLQCAYR